MNELIELLEAAGHADFRDARGPMGFTQRQAGGKFTRDEADEFIEKLRSESEGGGGSADEAPPEPGAKKKAAPRRVAPAAKPAAASDRAELTPAEKQLRRIPTPELAAELQRRGWIVVEP